MSTANGRYTVRDAVRIGFGRLYPWALRTPLYQQLLPFSMNTGGLGREPRVEAEVLPSPYPLSSFTGFGRRSFVDNPRYPSIKLAIGSLGIAGPYLSCNRNDNGSRHPPRQGHGQEERWFA
jgi:hypothetical protein